MIITVWAESKSDAASYAALQMRLLLSDQESDEQKSVATSDIEVNEVKGCEDKRGKVHSLLEFIPSAESAYSPEAKQALNELLQLSKASVFNQDCTDWLNDILAHFNTVKLKHKGYKQYLYSVLSTNKDKAIGALAVSALDYSLMYGALTAEEWKSLKAALRYATHQDIKLAVELLYRATVNQTQSQAALEQQIDELLVLANAKKLGMPLAVKPGYLTRLILTNVHHNFPNDFMQAYIQHREGIERPVRMAKYIRAYVLEPIAPERYQLLSLYLADIYSSDVQLNKRDAKSLLFMLNSLKPASLNTKEGDEVQETEVDLIWHEILAQHHVIINTIVQSSPVGMDKKQYWLNYYQQTSLKVGQMQ